MNRLIFFGDSICVGQGVSIHRGWVPRLAARVAQLRPELVVVNASVNGNTTRQALERMPYEVQSGGVMLMIVQFGLNDCNHWETDGGLPRVSLRAFEANLHEIIDRATAFGARSVVVNTNHPTRRTSRCSTTVDGSYEESNRRYNDGVRRVAAERADVVHLNDIEATFGEVLRRDGADLSELLLDDGLHLAVGGHDVYLEQTWPLVESSIALRDEGVLEHG